MITIVREACTVNDRQGVIVVQADSQEEVMSPTARQEAIKTAAALGLSRPGLSGNDTSYPVDADGRSDDDVMMGRRPTAAYRCDYRVTAGL